MRDIAIFAGSSHPELAQAICKNLGIDVAKCRMSKFANKETNVEIKESVRDMDVYIIQSGCGAVNDMIMELLIMISACRIASAKKVTAVIPCFPYARQPDTPYKKNGMLISRVPVQQHEKLFELQASTSRTASPMLGPRQLDNSDKHHFDFTLSNSDLDLNIGQKVEEGRKRKTSVSMLHSNTQVQSLVPSEPTHNVKGGYKHWCARAGTLLADILMAAGADHIITMDLHDPQFQGFFNIPVDNLYSKPLLLRYIKEKIPNYKKAVIVSPDAGGAKRSTAIADKLNMEFALVHKDRKINASNKHSESEMMLVGDVEGRDCILIDDIADTSATITRAASLLKSCGASKIYALVTHGILSGDALDRISASAIDEIIVGNTVPQQEHLQKCPKIKVFDVAPLFSEAIRRIHNGESVSFLFDI